MKITLKLTIICILTLLESCIISKDARILKKTTKEWRNSKIVLHAWADNPLSGVFLTLRENGKFEQTSSGLVQSFEAGTWINSQDTLKLVYLDSRQNLVRKQSVLIDRQKSTLLFERDSTAVQMRLKIMQGGIK